MKRILLLGTALLLGGCVYNPYTGLWQPAGYYPYGYGYRPYGYGYSSPYYQGGYQSYQGSQPYQGYPQQGYQQQPSEGYQSAPLPPTGGPTQLH